MNQQVSGRGLSASTPLKQKLYGFDVVCLGGILQSTYASVIRCLWISAACQQQFDQVEAPKKRRHHQGGFTVAITCIDLSSPFKQKNQ